MRRGFGYVGRYVMTKNRALRLGYIGLPLIFALLIPSCAPVSYDFIGNWNRQPDKLTYVNHDQHIKITFPNDKWEVYTEPLTEAYRKIWMRPARSNVGYHVMIAIKEHGRINIQILIIPVSKDVSLDEFLAFDKRRFRSKRGTKITESKVVERNNRTIGLLLTERKDRIKTIMALFKEEARFTALVFGCSKAIFETEIDQFWAIVDSYEYID